MLQRLALLNQTSDLLFPANRACPGFFHVGPVLLVAWTFEQASYSLLSIRFPLHGFGGGMQAPTAHSLFLGLSAFLEALHFRKEDPH